MPSPFARLLCLLMLVLAAGAAERTTLSPATYAEMVPAGKEVDAVFGDYLLRNERLVAVIADPQLMDGRSGSRKYGMVSQGAIIDLSTRGRSNDLLLMFNPVLSLNSGLAIRSNQIPGEPHHQDGFVDTTKTAERPERAPLTGPEVSVSFTYDPPGKTVVYRLADGWPYILMERSYLNHLKTPLKIQLADATAYFDLGPRFKKGLPDFTWGQDSESGLVWVYDSYYGQAYGVTAVEGRLKADWLPTRPGLGVRWQPPTGTEWTLAPAAELWLSARLYPGADLFAVQAAVAEVAGTPLKAQSVSVSDPSGPVAGALVTVRRGGQVWGAGRTDAKGQLSVKVPMGPLSWQVLAGARPATTLETPADAPATLSVTLPAGAWLSGTIRDEQDHPLPAKVTLRGRNGTKDPDLGPPTGDRQVANLLYTPDGQVRQELPPGDYQVTVSRGPEYDLWQGDLTVTAGQTTAFTARLPRRVQTPGWVAADLGNRSTQSRVFSTATVTGRVLNLAAEGLEFAPATERDTIFDYTPTIAAMGLGEWLKSCPGIGLTQRVRKTYDAQNAFPVRWVPGMQDGGAPQRPQHIFQAFWLNGWYGPWTDSKDHGWVPGDEKLIQVTPPDIWPNDGRSDGMERLFYPLISSHEDCHRNGRLSILRFYHAMEVQPLSVFADLPAWDPADPRGEADQAAWYADLDRRRAEGWPVVKDRNRDWLRILRQGYRITGVANSNATHNANGSGTWRTWVRSATDQPASIEPLAMVRALRSGHAVMSNGPFLEVSGVAGAVTAGPGDNLPAPAGKVTLAVRVQCPNWLTLERVQVLYNGLAVRELDFRRATTPARFADGPVQFDQRLELTLPTDTFVQVWVQARRTGGDTTAAEEAASDEAEGDPEAAPAPKAPAPAKAPAVAAPVPNPARYAMSNPIWCAVAGPSYKPHPPTEDLVYSFLEASGPLGKGPADAPLKVRLTLKNFGKVPAADALPWLSLPAGLVKLSDDCPTRYELGPGEEKRWEFTVAWQGEAPATGGASLHLARSSVGVGRRAVGLRLIPGKSYLYLQDRPVKERSVVFWRPEQVSQRPVGWGLEGPPDNTP